MHAWNRDRGIGGDESHGGGFGEVNKWSPFDDEVLGNGDARPIVSVEPRRSLQGKKGEETAEKGIIDG